MICTYLTDEEFKKYSTCQDRDVDEALQEARACHGRKIYVQEHEILSPAIFKKNRTKIMYTLYLSRHEPEVHTINFYFEGSDSSVNTVVDKPLILAYLYGIITGFHQSFHQ